MTRSMLALSLAALTALPAWAENTYIADNHFWELDCSGPGYVLTSVYPIARIREAGASSSVTDSRERLEFASNCAATHPLFGNGSWCWANGGFQAEFREHRIGFPRQELYFPGADDEISGCGC